MLKLHDDPFIKYLERKNLSQKTISDYQYYYERFGTEFTQKSVDSFLDTFRNNGSARAFIGNYREFLVRKKPSVSKIFIPKVTGRREKKIPKVISHIEVQDIEKVMGSERNKLMLVLSFYCGLRVIELLNIVPYSFDWKRWWNKKDDDGLLTVKGKGKKERIVFVPSWLMRRLFAWLEPQQPLPENKPIFRIKGDRWRKLLSRGSKNALGRHINPHLLRHSCATFLLEKGMTLQEIGNYLGHQSIETTQIYAQISRKNLGEKYSEITKGLALIPSSQ